MAYNIFRSVRWIVRYKQLSAATQTGHVLECGGTARHSRKSPKDENTICERLKLILQIVKQIRITKALGIQLGA
ncbi:hypothetical protein Y032_0354g3310 [Ancylostoma ceylanicum]|uniref:Uncharacterized protein n=1 Tax=Ancylostoma ceylanicum TaxID=53326 RepID=A0A016RWF5_9BILA|nr:hypothetical protein Y032_0354g3310 [Ancylostoma ceylanicum]